MNVQTIKTDHCDLFWAEKQCHIVNSDGSHQGEFLQYGLELVRGQHCPEFCDSSNSLQPPLTLSQDGVFWLYGSGFWGPAMSLCSVSAAAGAEWAL